MQQMIEVQNLSKSFTKPILTKVLKEISFTLESGTWASLMGPSGSGKSTLLSLLAGLDTPSEGSLKLLGKEISTLSEEAKAEFRARNIGFIFQNFRLLPSLTVEENIRVPMEILGRVSDASQERWIDELIERVGLSHRRTYFPSQLSGGEQQRVAVARAFSTKPAILLADEPTGNLDDENSEKILDLLSALHKDFASTLLVVSHDPAVAARATIRFKLQKGQLSQDPST
jgi:putative ABC transport system ATP-binding protein